MSDIHNKPVDPSVQTVMTTGAAPVPSRVVQGSVSTDQPLYAPLSDEACDAVIVAVAPQISDYAYALGYGEHFGTVRAARALIREIVASLPKEWHEGNESPEWIAKLERFRKSVTPPRTSEAP